MATKARCMFDILTRAWVSANDCQFVLALPLGRGLFNYGTLPYGYCKRQGANGCIGMEKPLERTSNVRIRLAILLVSFPCSSERGTRLRAGRFPWPRGTKKSAGRLLHVRSCIFP